MTAGDAVERVFHVRHGDRAGGGSHSAAGSVIFCRNGIALFGPMAGLGLAMGVGSAVFPAWAAQRYDPALSGVISALVSAAGVGGGLLYGKVPPAFGGSGCTI
jgi:hypothetical protein